MEKITWTVTYEWNCDIDSYVEDLNDNLKKWPRDLNNPKAVELLLSYIADDISDDINNDMMYNTFWANKGVDEKVIDELALKVFNTYKNSVYEQLSLDI